MTKIIIELEMDGDEQNCCLNIWKDPLSMKLLIGGSLGHKCLQSYQKKCDEISLAGGYTICLKPSGS
jgi:hypothetical protein